MDDKQAYVEDYNSVLSEVIPVPRRQAGTKRQSGLSQCMNMSYDNVQSDSGYSSHSAEQSRQGKELEDDRSTPTDHHTPPPVPAHHRRQISQLNSVMNQSPQMPTPTNSRPGSSKNLSRSNSPAVRDDRDRRPPPPPQQQQQQRPESPTDSDDESDCDCANCRGLDQKPTPASPLSQPWNLNYPPFNGPPPGPPGPPGPPMLSGSFPKNYGQPGFPPMGAPYGRYAETSPPYGRPGQQQLLPPVSFDEEAIDDEQHDLPPRRPDSTSRGKPRPMSYSGSTSQNPVSSHGSWGAYGSGYPTPGGPLPPGSQPPPAPGYPPSSYRDPTMGGAAGSPQGSSALTYGYAPPGPSPYPGYPPPPQGYPPYNGAEMVPYPYNAPPHPSSDYGGSIPPQAGPMPLNRRYSMHRSGELPPPRDYASMESPQQGGMPPMAGGPPGPMNRRSSQRGGQQPPYMHQDYHQRSISVPPGSYEAGAPVQDGRRRVTTPQPLLSSRTRRDSNTSASAASSRLPPMPHPYRADTGHTPSTYTDSSPGAEPHPSQPQTPHHQNPNRLSGHFPRFRSPSANSQQQDPNYGALVPRHPAALASLYNDNESAITTDYSDIPEESDEYAIVPIPEHTPSNIRMYYPSNAPIRLQIHGQPGPAQRIQLSGVPHMRDHSIELTVTYRYVSNSERRRIEEEAELEEGGRGGMRMIEGVPEDRGRRSVELGHREYVLGEE